MLRFKTEVTFCSTLSGGTLLNSLPLSVVYITQDAGSILGKSLASVCDIAQEIVVVDSGSLDNTLEVAKSYGAQIFQHSWQGFPAQRQWAVDRATHDWVLMMDSDEVLTKQASTEIKKLLCRQPIVTAYKLRRCSYFHGSRIRFGDWRRDEVIRLFDRSMGNYDPTEVVHESWHTRGDVGRISEMALQHYSYTSYRQLMEKMQHYAELNAQKVYARGHPVSALAPMSHALAAFFRGYVLRLGCLDGVDGAAIAWTIAMGAFMKYAIAREIQVKNVAPS